MIPLLGRDHLTRVTHRALAESLEEARATGRVWPRIVYSVDGREWSFRLRFDDFLALAVGSHGRFDAMKGLLTGIGFTFFHVAQTLGEISKGRPHLLAEAREKWDATVFCLLRSCGPRFVVIIDQCAATTSGEPPALVAVGLHPVGWVGFTSTCRKAAPIISLMPGEVHARVVKDYLRVFGPEKN